MIDARSRVNAKRSLRSLCDAADDRRERARIDRRERALHIRRLRELEESAMEGQIYTHRDLKISDTQVGGKVELVDVTGSIAEAHDKRRCDRQFADSPANTIGTEIFCHRNRPYKSL